MDRAFSARRKMLTCRKSVRYWRTTLLPRSRSKAAE